MDIETESLNGEFPDENVAQGRVLLVTFCDEFGDLTIMGLKPLSLDAIARIEKIINEHVGKTKIAKLKKFWKTTYRQYANEALMLKDLFSIYIPKMPAIFGWNFLKYDMRYLVNRCKRLGIKWEVCSPTGHIFTYFIKDKFAKNVKHKVELPTHRIIHDYLQLYAKFDTSVKLKTSTGLGNVATDVLGVPKIPYVGQLQDLYDKDFEKFVAYGSVDSILVQMIDAQLHCFDTLLNLSTDGRVPLHEAYFASGIIENLYQEYFIENNKVMVSEKKFDDNMEIVKKYKGAYVKEPEVGIMDDVLIYDFTSQFPSLMIIGNIGTDTLIGKTGDKGQTFRDFNGETHQIDPSKHIWLANGTVFRKDVDSSTRTIVNKLFAKRVDAKDAFEEIDVEMSYLVGLLAGK
jgi:DNA polymerase elongation subunit (family B)